MDGPKVLIVDDDPLTRMIVTSRIEQLGASVHQACDGLEAFALLRALPVDLVIADLEMPHVDGYALLGCIRGTAHLKHIPVIVLTGHEDRASLERALISGATSFLVKPLNWVAFGQHIKHLLAVAGAMREGRAPRFPDETALALRASGAR